MHLIYTAFFIADRLVSNGIIPDPFALCIFSFFYQSNSLFVGKCTGDLQQWFCTYAMNGIQNCRNPFPVRKIMLIPIAADPDQLNTAFFHSWPKLIEKSGPVFLVVIGHPVVLAEKELTYLLSIDKLGCAKYEQQGN